MDRNRVCCLVMVIFYIQGCCDATHGGAVGTTADTWKCWGQEIPPTTSDKHIIKASKDIQQTSVSAVTY